MSNEDDWISVADAAELLGRDCRVVYRLIEKEKLSSRNLGLRKTEVLRSEIKALKRGRPAKKRARRTSTKQKAERAAANRSAS